MRHLDEMPIGTRTHELMAYSGAALRCVCPLLCPPTTRDGPNGHIVDPTLRTNGFHGFREARHRVSIANGPNFDMGEPARYQQNRTSIAEDLHEWFEQLGAAHGKARKTMGPSPKGDDPIHIGYVIGYAPSDPPEIPGIHIGNVIRDSRPAFPFYRGLRFRRALRPNTARFTARGLRTPRRMPAARAAR